MGRARRAHKIVAALACMAAVVSLAACGSEPDPCTQSSEAALQECANKMAKDLGIEGMHCAPDSTQAELEACGKRVAQELGTDN